MPSLSVLDTIKLQLHGGITIIEENNGPSKNHLLITRNSRDSKEELS